jgi:hypothetical protein
MSVITTAHGSVNESGGYSGSERVNVPSKPIPNLRPISSTLLPASHRSWFGPHHSIWSLKAGAGFDGILTRSTAENPLDSATDHRTWIHQA